MIPEKFRMLLIEFVSEAENIPHLVAAVLYGSVLKGEVHKKSDIDILLLFDTDHNPEVGEESRIAHQIASNILRKHEIEHSFSFVMVNINDLNVDIDFLRTVTKEGVIIWARPEMKILEKPHPNLEPMDIFSYSLSSIPPKEKMVVHRALYGYRVEKVVKGKKYVSKAKGIVKEYGKKIGNGVIIIPSRESNKVIDIFEKHGVDYRQIKAWI